MPLTLREQIEREVKLKEKPTWVNTNKRSMRYSTKQRYLGKCRTCGAEPKEGMSRCERCLKKIRDSVRKTYKRRLENNQCRQCGDELTNGSPTWCEVCLEKQRERNGRWRCR